VDQEAGGSGNHRGTTRSNVEGYWAAGRHPESIHQMVLTLRRVGLIRRKLDVARSIDVLVNPQDLPALRPRNDQSVNSSVQRYSRMAASIAMIATTQTVSRSVNRSSVRADLIIGRGRNIGCHPDSAFDAVGAV
jgi:hypothetical protein